MTTANKITILRILLIPFFVVEVLYYVETGNEVHRLLAILSFAVTAILDGVDGYIARRYNQIANWHDAGPARGQVAARVRHRGLELRPRSASGQVPLWLTGIDHRARPVDLLIGVVVVRLTVGKVTVHPRVIGKIATVFQMVVVLWILLGLGL